MSVTTLLQPTLQLSDINRILRLKNQCKFLFICELIKEYKYFGFCTRYTHTGLARPLRKLSRHIVGKPDMISDKFWVCI